MRFAIVAAVALSSAPSPGAQSMPDLNAATPIAGSWSYGATVDGSEAVFADATGYAQLWVHCSRASRQVSISRSTSAAAPLLNIWTSSASRAVPSSFDSASRRVSADLANYDPLLDALATSRGRIGISMGIDPALVVPAWPEVARVVEDCRA